jgi:hypothetical protein
MIRLSGSGSFLWAVEAVEAIEVAEAANVNEAAGLKNPLMKSSKVLEFHNVRTNITLF